ncbi:hypothetical protein BHE74_00053389 [Ensete ventricosum]|nr:hypothetical protein BHE74_00053389 [Ensete ventricosum]
MVSEPRFSCERLVLNCMMRLKCVESFYAFLLRFRSKSSKEKGRPTIARPSARATDHDHTPCRGDRPWLDHLQGWQATASPLVRAVGCSQGCVGSCQQKEVVPPATKPQGPTGTCQPARGCCP